MSKLSETTLMSSSDDEANVKPASITYCILFFLFLQQQVPISRFWEGHPGWDFRC